MNELIKKRVKENMGKEVLIFLNNGFRYEGRITGYDNNYVEINDYKIKRFKIISYAEIGQIDIKEVEDEKN